MPDEMVRQAQKWLNTTYKNRPGFGSVSEDGQTGWETIHGLIRALQIELGITETANNFGAGTQTRFTARWPQGIKEQDPGDTSTSNVYAIIQCALWCKGYSTGSNITTHFYGGTGSAIKDLKTDIGIGGDSTVTVGIMKALLTMDQFVLLFRRGGRVAVRKVQQKLNRDYGDYVGIVPTDGVYGRKMNKALIQVLQAIEGFTPAEATGNFGAGTRSRLKVITASNARSHPTWVWFASVMLTCNGYPASVSSEWSEATEHLEKFQREYALPVSGKVDRTTWMSLLTSKGDPDRPCVACDTRFEITDEFLAKLKSDGYKIVGRYLTEPGQDQKKPEDYFKAIRPGELERIVKGGMKFFPIFQENSRQLSGFTPENGARHAREVQSAAQRLGVPPTIIYFAVDMDVYEYQIDQVVDPYFKAIKANLGGGYSVGIYASRNTCTRITKNGHAISSFVSDMSYGFSGNLGYPIPTNWNYDQFTEISGYGGRWDLDKVAHSGRVPACDVILSSTSPSPYPDKDPTSPDQDPLLKWAKTTEQECLSGMGGLFNPVKPYRGFTGESILEWLRKPEYWGGSYTGLWRLYTPELPTPSELAAARALCDNVCSKQPVIKGTLPRRDIAHMAATALGCLTWGIEERHGDYGLGDLGGWPLDLLQMWGFYRKETKSTNLTSWLHANLGTVSGGKGFGYSDVLADADAWLIARHMKRHSSDTSLTDAMSNVFARSEIHRIAYFYRERFNADTDNVVAVFKKVADGIDAWGFENIPFSEDRLLNACGADRLPSASEAEVLARAYAAFLSNPRR